MIKDSIDNPYLSPSCLLIKVTSFEILTLTALRAFEREQVDVAIVEGKKTVLGFKNPAHAEQVLSFK